MKIYNSTNNTFKGYDAIPLKALYMQGLKTQGEINIFREMKNICKQEGIDLFLNQNCKEISQEYTKKTSDNKCISIWGQDNKAFVINKNGKMILWNTKESLMPTSGLNQLSDYSISLHKYAPRGGNYFLGYKNDGEKWLLINAETVTNKEHFKKYGDTPTMKHLKELFNIKNENIFVLKAFTDDLDEIVRPVGFPHILVNDYNLCLENLEKMKEKFPKSHEVYFGIKKFIDMELNDRIKTPTDEICKKLEFFRFKPIRIGGHYIDDINYMNSLAFENKSGKLSYITNSTKKSYPELEYLEKLFENQLREKVPNISDVYFVSGGKRIEKSSDSFSEIYGTGLSNRNTIMDILANRNGGIHCMTAEIPDFDKLNVKETISVLI